MNHWTEKIKENARNLVEVSAEYSALITIYEEPETTFVVKNKAGEKITVTGNVVHQGKGGKYCTWDCPDAISDLIKTIEDWNKPTVEFIEGDDFRGQESYVIASDGAKYDKWEYEDNDYESEEDEERECEFPFGPNSISISYNDGTQVIAEVAGEDLWNIAINDKNLVEALSSSVILPSNNGH